MATNHVPQIVEALQRGRLAVFVGADLPQAATGLPSRADLAAGLAERLGLGGPAPLWPEIAGRYEASAGLNALISWLRDQLETTGQGPGPFGVAQGRLVHGLLAQLPVTTYITTAYDTRLHEALREVGRRPNLPVVDAASLGLLDIDRPTVVHLFGTYDRPDSLVLTASQLRQLPQTKAQILAGLVHPTLANQSVLIVGQDLRDTHFQTLYQTALFQAGTIRPSAYAAWPGLEEWEVQTWRAQEVRVLDLPAVELLGELAGEPQATPVPASQPTPQPAPSRRPEPPQFERLYIDPEDVPYATIRDLLEAAFDAGTLRRFCQARPAFEPLLRRFSPADGVSDMVDDVLEYCRTELLWDDLLAEVARARPRHYARFEPDLRGQAFAQPSTGQERRPVDAVVPSQAQVALPPDPGAGPESRPPTDRPAQTLTWLHLSDLHFREEEAYDANIVLRALLRDVGARIQEDGLRPDWIVVSGDIAFASRPDEYALARQFFDDLLEATGLGKDRLFVVPGNHDVDRKAITALAAGAISILNNRRAVNRFLADDTERALVFQRFHHYSGFINEYLGPHLAFDTAGYFFVQHLEVAGRSVAVLGLNSAWLAASDRDRHQLLLGERQVRSALEAAQDADLRLAVMHHPLDWLQDFDRNDAEPLLCGGCDFVLHGHMHDVGLLQARDPDSEAFIIAAGACYDTRDRPDRPNAYNLVRLDPVAGEGRVHLRMYSDRQGGFWTKDVVNYRNVPDGVYRFALPGVLGAR